MRMLCNRYNPTSFIEWWSACSSKTTFDKRWQVSFTDTRGVYRDYFFVAKPTRKQIRKLIKGIK